MSLAIANGSFVTLHYRMTLDDGSIAVDTFDGDPLSYVHGTESLVPGLERALQGRVAGAACTVMVSAAEGYGELKPKLERTVARSQFPEEIALEPGMSFQLASAQEAVPVWVLKVAGDSVTLTDDHPLAGQKLHFDVQVLDVRQATEKELAPAET